MEEAKLLLLTRRLLNSIANGDYETYTSLTDASITCYEPEAGQHLLEGLDFHRFFFDEAKRQATVARDEASAAGAGTVTTMVNPKVRMLSPEAAVVTYNRLVQQSGGQGKAPTITPSAETRVFVKGANGWKNVHLHRSGTVKPPFRSKL
jgi:calcium/calmodulin-dependent protein kinase (CaM kinase) II